MSINPFPPIQLNLTKEDNNPAIQLFGRRFEKDQTEIEYLAEFMLVYVSEKQIASIAKKSQCGFFDFNILNTWSNKGVAIEYRPHARLNLKLFSFLTSSKLSPCFFNF